MIFDHYFHNGPSFCHLTNGTLCIKKNLHFCTRVGIINYSKDRRTQEAQYLGQEIASALFAKAAMASRSKLLGHHHKMVDNFLYFPSDFSRRPSLAYFCKRCILPLRKAHSTDPINFLFILALTYGQPGILNKVPWETRWPISFRPFFHVIKDRKKVQLQSKCNFD